MAKTTAESLEMRLRALADRSISTLECQLDVIDARTKELVRGGFDKDLAGAASALSRSLVMAQSELRKLEKHDAEMARTPEQRFRLVVEYVKALPAEQRARFDEEIAGAAKVSVLG